MSVVYNSVDSVLPNNSKKSNVKSEQTATSLANKDEFLKMFTAQLQHQDPLNPMSNQDFTAQLAQFSQLEQLTTMNENLETTLNTNLLLNKSINNNMATTLIGKEVKVNGNYIQVNQGKSTEMLFKVPEDTLNVTIEILDSEGKTIRNISVPHYAEGNQSYQWDGKDNAGNLVDDGKYTYVIKGANRDGEAVNIAGYATGVITSVRYDGSRTILVCGEMEYEIGDIIEVKEQSIVEEEQEDTENDPDTVSPENKKHSQTEVINI